MTCPICLEEGIKSTAQTNGQMTTLLSYPGFHDEDGKYHKHDDNAVTTVGKCSNGHVFSYRYKNSCWCGWEGKQAEYKLIENGRENNNI